MHRQLSVYLRGVIFAKQTKTNDTEISILGKIILRTPDEALHLMHSQKG